MIMFDGYITGKAQKHFMKKSRILSFKIFSLTFISTLLPVYIFSISSGLYIILNIYIVLIAVMFIFILFPKSKKSKKALTPKKIYIKDKHIICIADTYEEIKAIKDVKTLYDYGEFYDLVFPFGKLSDKFVCQKNLLVGGSYKDFEELFKGKIIRKTKKKHQP